MSDDRTHGDDSAINDEAVAPTAEEQEAAQYLQFSKLADLARKAMQDHMAAFVGESTAPLLDPYNKAFAVLCGAASAVVTGFVGASDQIALGLAEQKNGLDQIHQQMDMVFLEIQQRKERVSAFDASRATKQ